jgi:hypothetical protein
MKKGLFCLILLIVFLSGCKKNEELNMVSFKELYPMQAGKIFYYRLDSTVISSSQQQLVTVSYNAKDSVETEFLDNLGRKSFRIFRYLRDTLTPISNNSNWKYTATYYATLDENRLEYVDNNLRFVSLTNPVSEGSQWKGAQYINTDYYVQNVVDYRFYKDYKHEYRNVGQPFQVKKGTIGETYTVFHVDDRTPDAPFDPNQFQDRNYSIEVYAKGIGLIYKDMLRYVYNVTPTRGFFPENFGIRLSLIDYK